MKAWADPLYGDSGWSRIIKSVEYYLRPGLTWPRRGARFSAQQLPAGAIFSDGKMAAFVSIDSLRAFHCLFNSSAFAALIRFQSDAVRIQFQNGLIQRTPVPPITPAHRITLGSLASRGWSLRRSLDTRTEFSHAFVLPAILQVAGDTVVGCTAAWAERVRDTERQMAAIQAETDERCFALYGIDGIDRRTIAEGFRSTSETAEEDDANAHVAADSEENEAEESGDAARLAAELVSWAVGVVFARFDVRLATGARPLPEEPEPFDPLPICSPGMLQTAQGLPVPGDIPPTYLAHIPWDGILVDDPSHPQDIERRVREVLEAVCSGQCAVASGKPESTDHRPLTTDHFSADHRPRTTDHCAEACEILGVRTLREYFRKPSGFFADHLKRYSKSRRQAPIYWPLSTTSGSYTLWIYYHRLTDQTLYACVNDFVQPKLNDLERDIPRLRNEKRTKELQAAVALQSELEEFKQELLAWAPRWKPNLNDGVLITACPLWKLLRLLKWRKDLEACWKKLEAGDYDWAHLAYSLWPDRVREKCKKDRSLAIAHGLEEICEVPSPNAKAGKRGKRKNATEAEQLALDKSEIM